VKRNQTFDWSQLPQTSFFIFIVFWCQGAKSSIDERAASAMLADQMDKELGGIATQV